MNLPLELALIGGLLAAPAATQAFAVRAESGSAHGLNWKVTSLMVGQTSTATTASGGSPNFLASSPQYRGVVGLLVDYGADGQFKCSGSLFGNSVITAGHCVSDGTSSRPDKVTAYFYDGDPTDQPVYLPGAVGVAAVSITRIHVNPLYTGELIDQNDIAVLRLADAAPTFATSYGLYTNGDLAGRGFNMAGYGIRSDAGGSVGITEPHELESGRLRQGDNRYDFRFGDPDFAGFFTSNLGTADVSYSYLADFDNGLAENDATCGLTSGPTGFGIPASDKYCDLGRGMTEISTAGGDSGGPQFIDGKLASLASYGITFGTGLQPGDVDDDLNSSFGEFNGFVPIFIHAGWIRSVVPEPATWALMLGGFMAVGGSRRRRRTMAPC